MSKGTVALLYNTAFYVYKFRINLINDLKEQGFDVVVLSPEDEYVDKLRSLGISHRRITMSQYGMNPLKEIISVVQLFWCFIKLRPVCSLHYTIKPNIFGSIAASLAGVPVVNNIAGAGRAFSDDNSNFARFITKLYKFSLRKSKKVFFQNNEDMQYFLDNKIVDLSVAERIPGSGVDLKKYTHSAFATHSDVFHFLFVGRLLREKGIYEYLRSAVALIESDPFVKVRFEVVGEIELGDSGIDPGFFQSVMEDNRFFYHGTVSPIMMPSIIGHADCVVLPSYYREGVPRSLLEAAAMAKPVITTHNVGCREVVDEGINGFKVPVRDIDALTCAMKTMLNMPIADRIQMGREGRKKMEREFDEAYVLKAYRLALAQVLSQ